MNKLYRFQYFTSEKFPFLHQVRDLEIFVELSHILYKNGYVYEDSFLNYPNMVDKKAGLLTFGKNDLMILTTRPPLSDRKLHKRRIYSTDHIYEIQLLEQIRTCFMSLSRQVMFLNHNIAMQLHEGFEDRACIAFCVNQNKSNKSAGYREISEFGYAEPKKWSKVSKIQKSCAFILFFEKAGILPKMLHVFGIGGEEGLIFSRILRNGLWEKLEINLNGPSRLIMVEFEIHVPEKYPTNLDFVNNFKYDVILDTELSR